MGRLTYSARKTGGIKAGQVVSKDLKKRIPPGIGSKAAARDPTLEIDIAGRCLTDEGFDQFADDLVECIRYRDEEHPTGLAKVTELHLQGNNLTIHSLAKLGEVVAASSGDIRELNLSRNDISVVSTEEKAIWKGFLDSFKNCYMLSKFDLSGNPIGSAGLEILAHAYIKSDLDYLEADAEAIIGANAGGVLALAEDVDSLELEKEKENESPRASRAKKPAGKGKAVKQNGTSQSTPATASKNITLADLKKYTCTRGLRSIPYFILSDIALTTRSAIHLSHMIAIQKASEHLITFLPPGKASAIPEAAQNDKSLIWQPNDELATFAKRLLEVTESIREFKSKAESDSEAFTNSEDAQRKLQSKLVIEYTRLTKRVRIETMKLEGVHSSDIAITALKMMVVSRALLLEDKDRPIEELPEDETESSSVETAEEEEQPTRNSSPVGYQPQTFFTFPDSFSLGPFHPDGATFDEEFPALQTAHESKSPTKRGGLGVKGSLESSSSPSQPIRSGKGIPRNSSVAQKARKQEWRFSLPFELWRRIIAGALDADGILDHDQQTRIIRYASDWDAVAYELTIKGAEDHQQIWKFLETVGCFTYTPLP